MINLPRYKIETPSLLPSSLTRMPYVLKPISRDQMISIQAAEREKMITLEKQRQEEWVDSKIKEIYNEVEKHLQIPYSSNYYQMSLEHWHKRYKEDPVLQARIVEILKELFPGCKVYFTEGTSPFQGQLLHVSWDKEPTEAPTKPL